MEASKQATATKVVSPSVLEAWNSLPKDVRAALVSAESGAVSTVTPHSSLSVSSASTSSNGSEDGTDTEKASLGEFKEKDPKTGAEMVLRPLERAPDNVFAFTKKSTSKEVAVKKTSSSTVTTKTKIVTSSHGWRNVFSLPVSYDVNVVPHGTLLDPANPQLLDATGSHPEGYNRRFAVIDNEVDSIYGDKIRAYFTARDIELHYIIINGGEPDKRPKVSETDVVIVCRGSRVVGRGVFSTGE